MTYKERLDTLVKNFGFAKDLKNTAVNGLVTSAVPLAIGKAMQANQNASAQPTTQVQEPKPTQVAENKPAVVVETPNSGVDAANQATSMLSFSERLEKLSNKLK